LDLYTDAVLALASDAVLRQQNDRCYALARVPEEVGTKLRLWPWETEALKTFFPEPPARLLVGGAGNGREPFNLARLGYQVVAFEAARALASEMAAHAQQLPEGSRVAAYWAGYEDLPILRSPTSGDVAGSLPQMEPFDGAILGWFSFTHLRSQRLRLQALRALAAATKGPILVSFAASVFYPSPRVGRIRRSFRKALRCVSRYD
jgi:hypothetical protein